MCGCKRSWFGELYLYSPVRAFGGLREVYLALILWLYSRNLKEISSDNKARSILNFQPSWRRLCKWIHLNIPLWFSSPHCCLLYVQKLSLWSKIPQRICENFLNATPRTQSNLGGDTLWFAFRKDSGSAVSQGRLEFTFLFLGYGGRV